jgi:hypothetical protein
MNFRPSSFVLRTLYFAGAALGAAAPAHAQWFGGLYFGANATRPADVEISQPARDTSLTFNDVRSDARPFTSPQYYGVRIGRLFGARARFGVDLELIHLKVIGRTQDAFAVSGRADGIPVSGTVRMDTLVQRYSMTHGLNFILVNFIARHPLAGGRFALIGRLGAGPTYPHAETTVGGMSREQYEIAGSGVHAAAGLDIKIKGRVSAISEYKLTAAKPRISIAEGTGRMRAVSHQVAVGLAFGLSR